MALNLFKKIFREDPWEKPRERQEEGAEDIAASEALQWALDAVSEKLVEARGKARKRHTDVLRAISKVGEHAETLGKAEFEPGDKAYSAANMLKDSFANRMKSLANRLHSEVAFQPSHSALTEFTESAAGLLKDMKETTPKQAFVLSNYFKREAGALIDGVKEAEKHHQELKSFLDSEAKVMWFVEELESKLSKLIESNASLRKLDRQETDMLGRLKELRKKSEEASLKLGEVMKSGRWAEANGSQRELDALRKEMSAVISEISADLSAVKRPLKKLGHEARDTLPKNKAKFLESAVKSPLKAAMPAGSERALEELLADAKKLANKGKISLKEKEKENLSETLRKLKSGQFSKLRKRYRTLSEKAMEMEERVGKEHVLLARKRKLLEDAASEYETKIEALEQGLRKSSKERESLEKKTQSQKRRLEFLISENMGRKVNLNIN